MNDDEVTVVELLEREGWDERVPPRPGSRLRVLAVMGAVVFGCGVAAAVVSTLPGDREQSQGLDEPSIIRFPERTAITMGPDEEESEQGGPAEPTGTSSGSGQASDSAEPATAANSTGAAASSTGASPTDPDPTSGQPSTTARSDTPDPPPPDPSPPEQTTTTTESEEPCFIWIFC
ncbi:hypothetical protein [Amycolatopsis cihanbeyliensis]|uniref:Uncharacterized protein n=1 Tax=Amycolatopsis cihanbeyliensis TaxID=1128664 RepID=A0A542DR70_AMYCI|nr:hypothetical protein [Amycolatopsis cihanbeyliensis]TQJ05603.1 hypothetical protein FB471_5440 [Amycolatopsis cihanbeyliensis]